MSTAWINFYGQKVIDCYILHTVLLAIKLLILLIIIFIGYYYAKQNNGK